MKTIINKIIFCINDDNNTYFGHTIQDLRERKQVFLELISSALKYYDDEIIAGKLCVKMFSSGKNSKHPTDHKDHALVTLAVTIKYPYPEKVRNIFIHIKRNIPEIYNFRFISVTTEEGDC